MQHHQIYLLIFLLTYFGVIIGVRSVILFRKTQVIAVRNFGKKLKASRAERLTKLALFLMIVVGVNFIFIPFNYTRYCLPIKFMEQGWLQTFGFIFGMLGLVFTFMAQLQMKDSWRLGVGDQENIELVTSGFFAVSRNPIYVGLGISFLGFFLMAPNVVSILFLLLIFLGVSEKVKNEEAFLLDKFGREYEAYRAKVGRWI